jgi:uroporphyrinogen III methyltransferase/synthase
MHAEKIYVGKKAGNHTMTQEKINALLIEKALLGLKVVRLKGGDPYVFGRGSEEALALKAAGVDYDVVPGITSAIGGLTYAGIPITHRGLSTSFHVMTGHLSKSGVPMNYEALTKAGGTCVILMGIGQAKAIAEGFLKAGKTSETPVAIIYHATTAQQATVSITLGELSTAIDEKESRSGLIVIGEVAELHNQLVNLEAKPLFGEKLLLTLPAPEVKNEGSFMDKGKMTNRIKLLQNLKDQGAEVIEMPLIVHKTLSPDPRFFSKDWFSELGAIIFTSPFGVTCFFKAIQEYALDIRVLAGPSIISIGASTTQTLKNHGIIPDYMPDKFTTRELMDLIQNKMDSKQLSKGICFYRSKLGNTEIIEALSEKTHVTDVHLYEVLPIEKKLDVQEYDLSGIVFTSRSAVEAFMAIKDDYYKSMIRSLPAYSIGPMTSEALNENQWSVIYEATTHTYNGIFETIMKETIK